MNNNLFFSTLGGFISSFVLLITDQIYKKYFLIIIYALCLWGAISVYYKWNEIPVHEHFIQVEHILTSDTKVKPIANICLNLNYSSSFTKEVPRDFTDFNKLWINGAKLHNNVKTIPNTCNGRQLPSLLGEDLFVQVDSICEKTKKSTNDIKEVFYFRDYRSIDSSDSLTDHDNQWGIDYVSLYGVNDLLIESAPFIKENEMLFKEEYGVEKGKGNQRNYIKYSGIILSDSVNSFGEVLFPDKYNTYKNPFMLEDISQAYYTIVVKSRTIDSVRVLVDFVGATAFSCMDAQPDRMNMSSIQFDDFTRRPIRSQITFHASFLELQNIQVMRCYFITVLITLFVTLLLKTIGSILLIYLKKIKQKYMAGSGENT